MVARGDLIWSCELLARVLARGIAAEERLGSIDEARDQAALFGVAPQISNRARDRRAPGYAAGGR